MLFYIGVTFKYNFQKALIPKEKKLEWIDKIQFIIKS